MYRSEFPKRVDHFEELQDVSEKNAHLVRRYQQLSVKSNRTKEENDEMANLAEQLKDTLMSAEKFNKLQDAIQRTQQYLLNEMEEYFEDLKEGTKGYVDNKKIEMYEHLNELLTEFIVYVDIKKGEIDSAVESKFGWSEGKTRPSSKDWLWFKID